MSPPSWPHGRRCRICVSLAEATVEGLRRRFASLRENELAGAELVEVRLDALAGAAEITGEVLQQIVADCPVPVGFTLRPVWHGGAYEGSEATRREILARGAAAGAAFVDVELAADWAADFVAAASTPVVLSHHWYEPGEPADLDERVAQARAVGAAMVKLVATAAAPDDAVPLLLAGADMVASGQPATCFCMGAAGRSSRLLAAARGAALIYAAAASGAEVAPGQWTVRTLVDELDVPRWQPGAQLYGLIGDPIAHSLSPAVFNAAFRQRDLPAAYVPLFGADLDAVLRLAQAVAVRGVSVTMPFKQPMAARSAVHDAVVDGTGAANTVVLERSGWVAANTDGKAVVDALAAVRPLAGARVALVGAGGAASAAAVTLAAKECRVTVLNRTPQRAASVAALAGGVHAELEALQQQTFDIIINATPVGMSGTAHADETPFPLDWLCGEELVLDMVYRPRRTPLLRGAAAAGCTVIDGLEMFVRQAAAQYRLLTGDAEEAPLAGMRATAARVLGEDSV